MGARFFWQQEPSLIMASRTCRIYRGAPDHFVATAKLYSTCSESGAAAAQAKCLEAQPVISCPLSGFQACQTGQWIRSKLPAVREGWCEWERRARGFHLPQGTPGFRFTPCSPTTTLVDCAKTRLCPAGLLPSSGRQPGRPIWETLLAACEDQRHQVELWKVPGGAGREARDEVAPECQHFRGPGQHPRLLPLPLHAAYLWLGRTQKTVLSGWTVSLL